MAASSPSRGTTHIAPVFVAGPSPPSDPSLRRRSYAPTATAMSTNGNMVNVHPVAVVSHSGDAAIGRAPRVSMIPGALESSGNLPKSVASGSLLKSGPSEMNLPNSGTLDPKKSQSIDVRSTSGGGGGGSRSLSGAKSMDPFDQRSCAGDDDDAKQSGDAPSADAAAQPGMTTETGPPLTGAQRCGALAIAPLRAFWNWYILSLIDPKDTFVQSVRKLCCAFLLLGSIISLWGLLDFIE